MSIGDGPERPKLHMMVERFTIERGTVRYAETMARMTRVAARTGGFIENRVRRTASVSSQG